MILFLGRACFNAPRTFPSGHIPDVYALSGGRRRWKRFGVTGCISFVELPPATCREDTWFNGRGWIRVICGSGKGTISRVRVSAVCMQLDAPDNYYWKCRPVSTPRNRKRANALSSTNTIPLPPLPSNPKSYGLKLVTE